MAGSTVSRTNTTPRGSIERELVVQVNRLTTQLRALTAKLDADSGVGDTDFASTLTDSGVTGAPDLIADRTGSSVTE